MSKLPFSLKGFTKISSDDGHSVLRNGQGHEIKILHKPLSKETRDQLQALPTAPDMEVRKQDAAAQEPVSKRITPKQPVQSSGPNDSVQRLASGGKVKPQEMANGGELIDESMLKPESAAAQTLQESESPSSAPITINVGTPPPAAQDEESNMEKLKKIFIPQAFHGAIDRRVADLKNPEFMAQVQGGAAEGERAPAQSPMPAQPGAMQMPPAPTMPMAAPQAAQSPGVEQAMMGGLNKQVAGINAQAAAVGAQGQQDALIAQQAQAQAAQRVSDFEVVNSRLNQERQSFQHDLENAHVDPSHYFSSVGTGGKIATVIGLIMGGMAVRSGRSNPALDVLNKQIDRDIDAQKAELGKKENLLSANMKQFGNLRDATEMTRVMQNDIVVAKLKEAAAKAASPMAKAAAMQNIGALEFDSAARIEKTAAGVALQRAQGGGSEQALQAAMQRAKGVNPELTKDLEARIVPGVGVARTAEDAKLAKEVQDRRTNIMTNLAAVKAMIAKAGTYEALGPHNDDLDRRADQIATDMAKLQDPNSVARPGEVEMVKKTLVAPGIFQQDKTAMSKLQAFEKEINARADTALKSRGVSRFQAQEGAIQYKDGRAYRKVQGGWAPVK